MGLIAAGVLFALVVLRVGLVTLGASLILRSAVRCPACLEATLLLHRPLLRRIAPWIDWRWCPACGWQGPGRRVRRRRFALRRRPGSSAVERPIPSKEPEAP